MGFPFLIPRAADPGAPKFKPPAIFAGGSWIFVFLFVGISSPRTSERIRDLEGRRDGQDDRPGLGYVQRKVIYSGVVQL